jgi:class 3 adenylate cyclase
MGGLSSYRPARIPAGRQDAAKGASVAEEPGNARPSTARGYGETGERLLEAGESLLAYDTLAGGLKQFPGDVRLRQLLALSLARTGASRLANQILTELANEGVADEETLGLLGRTHKDLWTDSSDDQERRHHLGLAFRYYREAHERSQGYWSGINAATMALLLGRREEAAKLAGRVREQCLNLRKRPKGRENPYWLLATLGEAALLLGNQTEAEDWYSQASALARRRLGDVASTRRNARLIGRYLGLDAGRLDACLHIPSVVVFSGHLIDRPGRNGPRFPPQLEPAVRDAIREWLRSADAGFGYAAAACGSDILFLEALLEAGTEAHVVLPYNRDQFLEDSVDIVPGSNWAARYEQVLARAAGVITASDHRMAGGGRSYEYGFLILDGYAAMRADELDTELVCLAVWDGLPGDGPGGTAGSVERWRASGRHVEVIDLAAIRGQHGLDLTPVPGPAPPIAAAGAPPGDPAFEPEIVGLLFGDVRGFSRLTEEQIPAFVTQVLGAVATELARSPHRPLLANTWGDGLYFVFRTVQETGEFALQLSEAMRGVDWAARGLPADLGLRIGLHTGPVYACLDPVTGRRNYLGAHVSRAARIEPITPPGEVYASGAFAALARTEQVREFVCAYVGQTPHAKGYGTFPTYVVHHRRQRQGQVPPAYTASATTSGRRVPLSAEEP